jgi:hypothetical protein
VLPSLVAKTKYRRALHQDLIPPPCPPFLSSSLAEKRLSISTFPAAFLTGSGSQTEFDVTYSKQTNEKILTGARTHIKLFEILQMSPQNDDATSIVIPSEAVSAGPPKSKTGLPGRRQVEPGRSNSRAWGIAHEVAGISPTRDLLFFLFVTFGAFLPGTAQYVESDVTYSKQTTGTFLPGATTAAQDQQLYMRGVIFSYATCTLDVGPEICKLRFSTMATLANPLEEVLQDFQFPQREAAFFYGLFLRGHSAEELRKDIQVPAAVLAKWDRETVREPQLRPILETIVRYRQHVLAIFENLICHDATTQKLQ